MKTDDEIRNDVINELRWDPQLIDSDVIGVAVTDGAVTLGGHVSTYAEKMAAARAAERVYGVRAVAITQLQIKLVGSPRDDSDIAKAIAHVLDWNVQIPEDAVHARVQSGWVTLEGEVQWDYQRREVERAVRQIRGVLGVRDTIIVRSPTIPEQVEDVIENAFEREARVDARHVEVKVSEGVARLYGNVHSMHESKAATAAAASAPGITRVENFLVVTP
jgi:osmotically-inducible protein OsmY